MIKLSVFLLLGALCLSDARVYEKCHLARRLLRLDATLDEVANYVCVASVLPAQMDSRKKIGSNYGIFQIPEEYCGTGLTAGGKCNVRCSNLHDNNIADDFRCAKKIVKEKGFEAWAEYTQCKGGNTTASVEGCTTGAERPGGNGPLASVLGGNVGRSLQLQDDGDDDYDYYKE